MHSIKIDVSIRFKSKWHCGSGEGGLLLDRLIRRDSRDLPFIPGSTLKGVVRESCEKLSRTLQFPPPSDPHDENLVRNPGLFLPLNQLESPVDALFGNKLEEGGLVFRDARLEGEIYRRGSSFQTRVRMYRALGTAAEKQLFSSEYAIPLHFKTTIEGYHKHLVCFDPPDTENPDFPPYGYCLLVAGLCFVDRLGGDKSTGAGRVDFAIDAIVYNGKSFEKAKCLELLDKEFYEQSLAEQSATISQETG